jgi:hypothetical protein
MYLCTYVPMYLYIRLRFANNIVHVVDVEESSNLEGPGFVFGDRHVCVKFLTSQGHQDMGE